MKTNVKELVDMMKSKGIGVPELAQKIGVDASTLYRKLGLVVRNSPSARSIV